jgi:hypothetical protein
MNKRSDDVPRDTSVPNGDLHSKVSSSFFSHQVFGSFLMNSLRQAALYSGNKLLEQCGVWRKRGSGKELVIGNSRL